MDAMQAMLPFVEAELCRAEIGARAWSTAYHVSLGTAGVLGILVGAIAQAEFDAVCGLSKKTLMTVLSMTAAVLTFMGGFGGFEAKWQANRAYRVELQQILIDLKMPNPDYAAIRERLRTASFDNNLMRLPPKPAPADTAPASPK